MLDQQTSRKCIQVKIFVFHASNEIDFPSPDDCVFMCMCVNLIYLK